MSNSYNSLEDVLADRAGISVHSEASLFEVLKDQFVIQQDRLTAETDSLQSYHDGDFLNQIHRMVNDIYGLSVKQIAEIHDFDPDENSTPVVGALVNYVRRRTLPAKILDVWFSTHWSTLTCYIVYSDRNGGTHARRLVGTYDLD